MWSHPDIRSADPSNITIVGLCPKLDKELCEERLFVFAIGKGIKVIWSNCMAKCILKMNQC
jgi:hypothetical protein